MRAQLTLLADVEGGRHTPPPRAWYAPLLIFLDPNGPAMSCVVTFDRNAEFGREEDVDIRTMEAEHLMGWMAGERFEVREAYVGEDTKKRGTLGPVVARGAFER